jgi:hypothetical protein
LLCTTGPITLLIDNAAIVKGIRRGPSCKKHAHNFRWRLFWEAAAGRDITVIKVKAHVDEESALREGLDPLHWRANALADEHAEAGARRAQLPAASVAEVLRLDKEATEVQAHLSAVALEVARRAPQLYGPSTKSQRTAEAGERARQRRDSQREAERLTEHRLCPLSGRCLNCLLSPTRDLPRLEFLRTPCLKRPGAIHGSHDLRETRGLWWCAVCGGTGVRHFKKLSQQCQPPTATGKRARQRLMDGLRPYHVRRWPDEDEELLVG